MIEYSVTQTEYLTPGAVSISAGMVVLSVEPDQRGYVLIVEVIYGG